MVITICNNLGILALILTEKILQGVERGYCDVSYIVWNTSQRRLKGDCTARTPSLWSSQTCALVQRVLRTRATRTTDRQTNARIRHRALTVNTRPLHSTLVTLIQHNYHHHVIRYLVSHLDYTAIIDTCNTIPFRRYNEG